MKNVSIAIGSIIMGAIVVCVHTFIQYLFTKDMPNFFDMRKIILFFIVLISCFVLSKRETNSE